MRRLPPHNTRRCNVIARGSRTRCQKPVMRLRNCTEAGGDSTHCYWHRTERERAIERKCRESQWEAVWAAIHNPATCTTCTSGRERNHG